MSRTAQDATPPVSETAATEAESLREKLAEQTERNLRLAADFENFKRRNRQDSEARASAQKDTFILGLLPAIDNLERALASGPAPGSQQLHQGVEMIRQQLRALLRQHAVEPQESVGQPFDPQRHDAISKRSDPACPNGAVLEVLQRGYQRGDKVFRPAKVVVNDLTSST